ncbi:MAG: type II toxin-antitoxin system VapC family toxin [Polyangiaceae bacterium]|nr:type II toxin-antitoxin system VapC family toxin [Polyangiaceae bacterium]
MTVLLDTNVVSAIMQRDAIALGRLRRERPGDVFLCSPVAAEIHFGLDRLPAGRRRQLLEAEYRTFRAIVQWADWTEVAAREFGRLKALLEARGQIIEDMDIAIGAVAKSLGARCATRNTRHLTRLDSLIVEDWSKAT